VGVLRPAPVGGVPHGSGELLVWWVFGRSRATAAVGVSTVRAAVTCSCSTSWSTGC